MDRTITRVEPTNPKDGLLQDWEIFANWVRSWDLSILLALHLLKQYLRSISRCVD